MQNKVKLALQSPDEETRRGALQMLGALPLSETRDLLFCAMGDESWRVRKEAVDVFVSTSPDAESIEMLLELLRNDENAGLRNSAVEAVCRIGLKAAPQLALFAGDADADVRKLILDIMGSIASTEFIPYLRLALNDSDINVAAAAAEHIGTLANGSCVPDLINAIIRNNSIHFRFNALAALGKMKSHISIPKEIIALAEVEILRKGVYECFGSIGDESLSIILLDAFISPQKSCRKAAVNAWYRIFLRSSATARKMMEGSARSREGSDLVPALTELYDPAGNADNEAVIAILGVIGDKSAIPLLLKAFIDERISGVALTSIKRFGVAGMSQLASIYPDAEEQIRGAICTIFGSSGFVKGSDLILEAINDPSPVVRKAAISSAAVLGIERSLSAMVPLLEDPDREVRNAVTNALHLFALDRCEAVRLVVRQMADSDSPEQRCKSAMLLATLEDTEPLTLLIKDEDAKVRESAITAIGKKRTGIDPVVINLALLDEDPDVRIAAAGTLAILGDASAADALQTALGDEDVWVKCAVLRAIAAVSPAALIDSLDGIIENAGEMLLITCLELLEADGSREAFEMVERALNSNNPDAVTLAVTILARQGGEWVTQNAERLLQHPSVTARLAWFRILSSLPACQARPLLAYALSQESDERVRNVAEQLLEVLT